MSSSLWLDGSLNPQQIQDKILEENDLEFLQSLLAFIDDSIHTDVPQVSDPEDVYVLSEKHNPSTVRRPTKSETNYDKKCLKDFMLLVKNSQRHKHTMSCYKYSPHECRFGMDSNLHVPESYVDYSTGEITYWVTDGMIAVYCPSILEAVCCNMDINS